LTTFWFYGFQIVVREHQLGGCQPWLTLDSELVKVIPSLGNLEFSHDDR
jgi:hypothetical protein